MYVRITLLWKFFIETSLKKVVPFFCFAFFPATVCAQTNISGIVNTYHRVVELIPSKAGVRVDDVTGLAYGNLVLLVQMKGASIVTTNTAGFGDTTSLNEAGNYEIGTICAVIGDTVFLFHDLLNSYNVGNKVQLVKFGEYYAANVIDTVKAASWNNITGKGGVLAIRAEEDLTLNAPLYADSTGYKGGSFLMHSNTCSNILGANLWYYDGSNTTSNGTGAYKGEGVVDPAATMNGGRGAPANGGGGGNNHNNGGGGGANLSMGGNGGGNYTTVAGSCNLDRHGLAGKALSSWNGKKIFAGGGGGAGHVNNNTPTHGGGNGGGIIFILAKNIIGNGYKISANGQKGGDGGSDGSSGGGAGGTIVMHVINGYSGSLTIETNGGNGGTENNQNILNRCYGAGGGGGGGVIYFNGSTPAITVSASGGLRGNDIGVNGCGTPVPAVDGSAGSIINNYTFRSSAASSNYCEYLLPVTLLSFDAEVLPGKKVRLTWTVENPEDAKSFSVERLTSINNWQTITTVPAVATRHQYEAIDASPAPGFQYYRLRLTGKDNSVRHSAQKKVLIKEINTLTIYPNPATNKITIAGQPSSAVKMIISDLSGKRVFEEPLTPGLSMQDVYLPALAAGLYFIRIGDVVEKLFIR